MALADTLHRLPPAATDFARSLFDHHWIEASWLYERRDVLHSQGALLSADGWLELEARTDAHVTALAKGGALVLDTCEAKALEGDVGELHTAIRLLCRADQPQRFNDLIEPLDWQEPVRARAVSDALIWDAPDSWQALVAALLVDESVPEGALGPLARVAGTRGWPLGEPLLGVLEDRAGDLEPVVWALGVLGVSEALRELYGVIQEDHAPAVRRAAALAALRFAPGEVLAYLEQVVETEAWAAVPLALGGGPSVWTTLSATARANPTPERMLAVGLFGHVEGIDLLLDWVEDEGCGEAAAEGLYLLTGAELHKEQQQWEPGVEPTESEDKPSGLLVSTLPRSRAVWALWLKLHGSTLRSQSRMRILGGVPHEPPVCLEKIGQTYVSAQVRALMLEELDVRYRLRVGAWPQLQQIAQRNALKQSSTKSHKGDFNSMGKWCLKGCLL